MTKDGIWLGAFGIGLLDEKHFTNETLNDSQKALRQKVLTAKLNLENSRKTLNRFVNDSKIMLLKEQLEQKREHLVDDQACLAQIRQLEEATKSNLDAKVNLDMLKSLQAPISENLPELAVWEILSLVKGYNFFEVRRRSFDAKLQQQEKELKALENEFFDCNDTLKILDENLCRAQANYDFYHNRFKELQGQKNSLEAEIASMEFELSYSSQMVDKLKDRVQTLALKINKKKEKFAELNRQLDIVKEAYTTLASKMEETRIAKSIDLGEVKIVSTASKPQYPVALNKRRNIAFAGVASLMLGLFIAFCLEFWQKNQIRPA
jgi:chromosome segregation ATPase